MRFLGKSRKIIRNSDINTSPADVDAVLNRGTIVETYPTKEEFRKKLLSGERLRFYIGFDATSSSLHLSHAKNIMLLEDFRILGHEAIMLFGDFTARIGDPTGEGDARNMLTEGEVKKNVEAWKKQIMPLMDFNAKVNPPKIMYNSDWLAKLTFEDVVNLASNVTVQQMLERDMFDKRMKEGKPIHLHEFLYPLMQGYDSVAMDVDVELCGTDQTFNALTGRTLLKKLKGKDKYVVAVTLMENPQTGELMSKSKGTGVFLNSSSTEMFGAVMAQPDIMVPILFTHVTRVSLESIEKIVEGDPMEAKKVLAETITAIFYGSKVAEMARESFEATFSKGGVPDDAEEVAVSKGTLLVDVLLDNNLVASKNEFKRLVENNAITNMTSEEKISDANFILNTSCDIKVGKRRFVKIVVK